MKKFFAIAAMIAVCSTASAQFTKSSTGGSSTSVQSDGWSTFYVQYNPINMDYDGGGDLDFKGLSVGYNKAFGISQSAPLYIEAGAGLTYAWYSDSEEYEVGDVETKVNILSLKVPVSILYDFQIPNSSISIYPFAGVTLRYNLSGKNKVEFPEDYSDYDVDVNLFDEDDMGDAAYKRFQIGWQIGVNAKFNNKFILGVSYGSDFSEIAEDTKLSTTSITLGYCF